MGGGFGEGGVGEVGVEGGEEVVGGAVEGVGVGGGVADGGYE